MKRLTTRLGRRRALTVLLAVVVGAGLVVFGWAVDGRTGIALPESPATVSTAAGTSVADPTSTHGTPDPPSSTGTPNPPSSTGTHDPPSSTSASTGALQALETLTVLPDRSDVPGYQRACGPGKGCSFGPAWTDDSTAPDGHNGCGTRNDVLQDQLADVVLADGSACVVVAGTLLDPYTGRVLEFRKADASAVQIDHVYSLARAYDMGAAGWTQQERTAFANDTELELLAVDGAVNQAKGDSGPAEWLPPDPAGACVFVQRYVAIAAAYDLAITVAERDTISRTLAGCG